MENLSPAPGKKILLYGVLILLIYLFAISIFGGNILLHLFGAKEITAGILFSSRLLFWSSLLLVFVYAKKVEHQKLLIWEERKYQFWQYLVSFIAIIFALVIGLIVIAVIFLKLGLIKESDKFKQLLEIFKVNQWLIFFTAGTAGIVEELTFRGYIQPRLTILTKSPAIAIIISSVLFGLLHFGYGTVMQMVGPFFIGFIFAIYYYNFRNIKILIFCHILWDVMAIYLQMFMPHLKK